MTTTFTLHPLPLDRSWGRGFGVYQDATCLLCKHVWVAVAPVGMKGKQCPACGYDHDDFVWPGDDGELPNDGAWLAPQGWI